VYASNTPNEPNNPNNLNKPKTPKNPSKPFFTQVTKASTISSLNKINTLGEGLPDDPSAALTQEGHTDAFARTNNTNTHTHTNPNFHNTGSRPDTHTHSHTNLHSRSHSHTGVGTGKPKTSEDTRLLRTAASALPVEDSASSYMEVLGGRQTGYLYLRVGDLVVMTLTTLLTLKILIIFTALVTLLLLP
jgi:hypothetical protein